MPIECAELHPAVGEEQEPGPGPPRTAGGLFLATLWFGLVAGWLELALVLAERAVNPHVSMEALRTNRHFVWMTPLADALILGGLGAVIAPLAALRWGLARWLALRLSVGLGFWTLLLTVEGLDANAVLVLASGLALNVGPWLERRGAGFGRLVRVSLPVLAVGLAVLIGLTYWRVTSAESRALAHCPPARRGVPNVLLIVLDDVRAASLSLHGYDRPTTPNLERLARRGIVFAEARSTAPWTLPSHASMLTGRWPHELSVGPDLPLDATFPTLAETLGREGYATAGFVGNTVYCSARYGLDRGFARYEDAYENQAVSPFEVVRSSGLGKRVLAALGYKVADAGGETTVRKTAAMLNRDVLGWLAKQPAGRPFFVFINYFDAHNPYVFHEGADPRFGMAALPLAEHAAIGERFWDGVAGKPPPAGFTPKRITNEGYTLFEDSYESCIAYLDRQVGLLLGEIERRGQLENTLVIVTSDHGEQFGERGLLGHGVSLYRREVHVPLLVIPPARASMARVVREPVSNREVAATVADWAELGPRSPFPGRSLTRFLGGGPGRIAETSPVLCEVQQIKTVPRLAHLPSSLGPVHSLVSPERVYIRSDGGREELYDLVNDARESFDLARYPQSRPLVERLRAELGQLCPDATLVR
jgi:arylsulfatase A-like enzyme